MSLEHNSHLQIAIDGPAGAGKSTVAKEVAKRLGLFYLDTGAMYRVIAYKALLNQISVQDELKIVQLASETEISMDHSEPARIWCDGEEVSDYIRTPEVSRAVSVIAAYFGVRERLVAIQRNEAKKGSIVMDGRDIGTNVLPEADVKVFLTASLEERARRRWQELKSAGKNVNLNEVAEDMRQRDSQDTGREVSPLEPAEDAIIIDTTGLEIEKIVSMIVELTRREKNESV